jgi:PAS domain S-box-containing protein
MLIFSINILGKIAKKLNIRFRSQAEKELLMFKLAVDMASDQIVITDTEGIILYANKAVEKVTGYKPSEIIGKKAGGRELWGGYMNDKDYHDLWKTINSGKPYIGEFRNCRKDGTFYEAESHIYPIFNKRSDIKYFAGLEIDISEKKQIERSKSEFVSLASHQLRSPLTSASLSLDLLLRGIEGELNYGQKKALKEIHQDLRQTSDLVQSLLDLSRIEMGSFKPELEPVEIRKICKNIIAENKILIDNKKIKLTENYKIENEVIMFDHNVIKVVLQNLLSNAIKYSLHNGLVSVSIRQIEKELQIKVIDTGLGIPNKEQDNIFSKFYRASNVKQTNNEGTGLGLSLIKPIIEASGGKIGFKSEENKGAEFKVVLPVSNTKI